MRLSLSSTHFDGNDLLSLKTTLIGLIENLLKQQKAGENVFGKHDATFRRGRKRPHSTVMKSRCYTSDRHSVGH